MTTQIEGHADSGFERVADAFERAFDGRPQMGASLGIRLDGEEVMPSSRVHHFPR